MSINLSNTLSINLSKFINVYKVCICIHIFMIDFKEYQIHAKSYSLYVGDISAINDILLHLSKEFSVQISPKRNIN